MKRTGEHITHAAEYPPRNDEGRATDQVAAASDTEIKNYFLASAPSGGALSTCAPLCRACVKLRLACRDLSQQSPVAPSWQFIGSIAQPFSEHLRILLLRRGDFWVGLTKHAVCWGHKDSFLDRVFFCSVWGNGNCSPWLTRITVCSQIPTPKGEVRLPTDYFALSNFQAHWNMTITANELPQMVSWVADRVVAESHLRQVPPSHVPVDEVRCNLGHAWSAAAVQAKVAAVR